MSEQYPPQGGPQYPQQPGQPPQQQWGPPPAPEKKRSWFARHKILTGLGAIVALFVVIGVASGGSNNSETSAATADQSTATTSASAAAPATTKAAPAPAAKSGIGTEVRDGKFAFTVTKVTYSTKAIGDQYLNKAPQGQFAILTITVKNIGNEPRTLSDSDQYLYIGDNKYSADTEAGIYANGNGGAFLNDINPGNQVSAKLIYDIPKGSTADKLEVHDSAFSGGADIALK